MWRILLAAALGVSLAPAEDLGRRPPMRELMGLNGHTVKFRPELYRPVASKVRDYHPLDWDIGKETDYVPDYPWARNRVHWENVYGSWVKAGFEIDACLMIQAIPPESWKDVAADGFRIGKAFASFFGPGGEKKLVHSLEIGNEPGMYSDERYREVFEAMAKGVRAGDAELQIVTCAAVDGQSHDYAKSLECVRGLEPLYDIINVHSYAQIENWPTWRRSFPEDPRIEYLRDIEKIIAWRDQNAPGKKVWVTEFGWDSTTKPNATDGDFKDWVGNTDEEQAVYLVRSFLVFSAMDIDRAYVYFFNDSDEPKLHAASGLTRNFVKKPSFFALQWLRERLGNYRFVRAIDRHPDRPWRFEFADVSDPTRRILAIWDPLKVGAAEARQVELGVPGRPTKAERLSLEEAKSVPIEIRDDTVGLGTQGYPVLVWFEIEG